jgi:Xaa-Pro aminopeptidase
MIRATAGTPAKDVDRAARRHLATFGYGEYFTHRLGHGTLCCHFRGSTKPYWWLGIGLEVHEVPYLNGGNNETLQVGHTFSDEPGIYIEGEVGNFTDVVALLFSTGKRLGFV